MAQQTINVGTLPNDGTGDKLRDSMIKVDANFTDLYTNAAIPIQNGSSTDAGVPSTFTGAETLPVSRGSGLLQTTFTKLATWIIQIFAGFTQSGSGAVARSVQNKLTDTINVNDFGATGNGTTDDTAAIQAAISSLPSTGGVLNFPSLNYKISSTLTIGNGSSSAASTTNAVFLVGNGGGGPFGASGTTLTWAGASGGTMVKFSGAMIGGGMQGNWIINGSGTAANGLIVNHIAGGDFGNITIKNCTGIFCNLTSQTTTDPYGGCRNNQFKSITIPSLPTGSTGLILSGITTIAGDILQNRFGIIDIQSVAQNGATGIQLGWCDFNTFDIVDIEGVAGGTSVGLLLQGPDVNHIPFLNKFGCFANNLGIQTAAGQKPYGNFIDVFDYADSAATIPTAVGVCGFAHLYAAGPGQVLNQSFGFQSYGFDVSTPSLPGGTGSGNSVTNTNAYPVTIYMTPATGSNVPGTRIIDMHGTDNGVGTPLQIKLRPGEKVYYSISVPGAWIWYGDIF